MCRHLLFMDYCHFKSDRKSGIMQLSTIDPEDHIIVIAETLCNSENLDDWTWTLATILSHGCDSLRQWLQHPDLIVFQDQSTSTDGAREAVLPLAHWKYVYK